ncbi:MAG: hypothetical protein HY300_13610 [Verrucomicrobia bacterium]|nr:hypothetical protein [Verrucomicrobiota bacterium]
MLTAHELFGFMPAALSGEILEFSFAQDKPLYKATLNAVAQARKVRPVFLEHQPRAQRHPGMVAALAKPALEAPAQALLQGWLLKNQTPLLRDFLDALGVAHKDGAVENLPDTMDDAKVRAAVDAIAAKHPQPVVAVYLNAFVSMNQTSWPALDEMLKSDARLQF